MEELERVRVFPFTAIVGMEKTKLALMAVAVDPTIGGVLLSGDKGTGKSTLVRAFADVLPEIPVVKGCPFNCNPYNPLEMCDNCYSRYVHGESLEVVMRKMKVVNLPLNITVDRLVGTIDIKRVLTEGVRAFQVGLLAEANRNILYIDEVNLLDDYVADLLLDAAALGWNIVEREGISFKHPAKFILVGSMNPEEGELRPQLLDRFGLYIPIEAINDPDVRVEIVKRVEEFHRDPIGFYKKWEPEQEKVREKIVRARRLLPNVTVDNDLLKLLAKTVVEMGIRTHRAEIVTVKVAKAIAALDGRTEVSLEDLRRAMELSLLHRVKSRAFEKPRPNLQPPPKLRPQRNPNNKPERRRGGKTAHRDSSNVRGREHSLRNTLNPVEEEIHRNNPGNVIGEGRKVFEATEFNQQLPNPLQGGTRYTRFPQGRGARDEVATVIGYGHGYPVTYSIPVREEHLQDLDLFATVNAAALRIRRLPLTVEREDFRVRVRKCRTPRLIVILLDCSGSMSVKRRVSIAKGLVRKLIETSYVRRDYVALITFRGRDATLTVPPTRKYEEAYEVIDKIPVGGRTPLAAALQSLLTLARVFRMKYRNATIRAILVTDGKANIPLYNKPIREELRTLANAIRRAKVKFEIYDTRPRGIIDPSPSYIEVLAEILECPVYSI